MTIRQVTSYVGECIGEHLKPDALGIKRTAENQLRLVTRKVRTANEPGEVFIITISRCAEAGPRRGEG